MLGLLKAARNLVNSYIKTLYFESRRAKSGGLGTVHGVGVPPSLGGAGKELARKDMPGM